MLKKPLIEVLLRDLLKKFYMEILSDIPSKNFIQRYYIKRSYQEIFYINCLNRAFIKNLYRDFIKRICQEISYKYFIQESFQETSYKNI